MSSAELSSLPPVTVPPEPTGDETGPLGRFERCSFRLARRFSRRRAKAICMAYMHGLGSRFVRSCTHRLLHVHGLEAFSFSSDDRILLVSNHRSFFDQFVLVTELYRRKGLPHRFYFPVRANFFYDRPAGVLLNAIAAGFAMYPPFFRQPTKRAFNRYSLDEAVALLREPGVLMGMHPEGMRNKGPDPYSFLPAQAGVGELCYKARPRVLPAFVLGLSNDLPRQVSANYTRKGAPIVVVFGEPVDLDSLYAQSARLATYKRIADRLMERIGELAAREREIRADLERAGAGPLSLLPDREQKR